MVSQTNEGQSDAAKSYAEESELNDMKQHADKIIQGIKKLSRKEADRAIWELFQNAVDLSEKCEVFFQLTEEHLIFRHNGEAFTPNTLDCLFKQVSSKTLEEKKIERQEGDAVGQYGTGFITTHAFGEVVDLSGALIKDPGYVKLENFQLDRTTDNWKTIGNRLRGLKRKVEQLLEQPAITEQDPVQTEFKYHTSSEFNKKNAQNAFARINELLPYVMTLNKQLHKVTVCDLEGNQTTFSIESLVSDGPLYKSKVLINESPREIFLLRSEDKQLSIILPFGADKEAFYFEETIPRLFLYYPLVGTEAFGVNYLLHSHHFQPTEPRDALYLKSENESTKEEEAANRNLLERATEMIFDFINHHSSHISNPIKLARFNFKTNSDNELLNGYFRELRDRWTARFLDFPLVENDLGNIKPAGATFFKVELLVEEDSLDDIYALASKFYSNLPKRGLIQEWTRNIEEWGLDDVSSVGIDELTTKIKEEGRLDAFDAEALKRFYAFLIRNDKVDLFSSKKLLPNIWGDFRLRESLNVPQNIPSELIEIADTLQPDLPKRHAKQDFISLIELPSFGRKAYIQEINIAIDKKLDDTTIAGQLSEGFLAALLRLCAIVKQIPVKEEARSRPSLMIERIFQFYDRDYDPINLRGIQDDELDIRSAQRKLVRLFLNDLSHKEPDWVAENLAYLYEVIEIGSDYDQYKELFAALPVYPNQNNELRKRDELWRDARIPKEIKNLYGNVVKPSMPIRGDLAHVDFGSLPGIERAKSGKSLAAEIESRWYDGDRKIAELLEGSDRDYVLEIIRRFKEDEKEGHTSNRSYKDFFPRTYANKSNILVHLADGEATFSILSLDEKSIELLGELAQNPARLGKILEKGAEAYETEQQKESSWEHKGMIGRHIEGIVREGLQVIQPDIEKREEQNGQDIIIMKNGVPVYYIEVKSRWLTTSPVRMSRNQTLQAVDNPDCYALCTVDMAVYTGGNKYEVKEIQEIKTVIWFNERIGKDTMHLKEVYSQSIEEESIRLGGDFRTFVPQSYIKKGMGLAEFESYLNDKLKEV